MQRPNTAYPGLPKSVSLLVVEDELRLRELLVDVAGEMGFVASGTRSAEEAIRLMTAAPSEMLILDLNLPGLSGMELLTTLRERWPQIQIVVLTGFGSLETARQAIHFDVVEFLTKPCPLSEVEKALHRARRKIDEKRLESPPVPPPIPAPAAETLADNERRLILAALNRNAGNRTAAAVELGISRRTLHYRLQEYQRAGWLPG